MISKRFHLTSFPLVGFLLILTATQIHLGSAASKCAGKADVIIVLDSSTSVGPDNWKLQLGFVKSLLAPLNIGSNADRVAFITYNTEANVEFNLDKYSSLADINKAVSSATFSEGVTATGDALKLAREDVLSKSRKDAAKLLFLVTDGKTNFGDDPVEEAAKIKKLGVTIISVGITEEIDTKALKSISTSGSVDSVDDFSQLSSLLKSLAQKTCKAKVTPPTVAPPVKCQKESKSEVMIVLDSSTSVGDDNWKLQLAFVKNLLSPLNIGTNGDRVGFVTYNTEATLVFGLNKYSTLADVNKAVDSTTFSEGITATGDALAVARKELTDNARKGVPKLLFLVTDGETNWGENPITEAGKLKKIGVKIITVGITEEINEKSLKAISSNGKVNSVQQFSQLSSLITSLQKETCDTKPNKCEPTRKAEVVVVLDSSTSVGPDNWKLELNFVSDLLKPLNVGPNGDRVGFITYNTDAKVVFDLTKYSTLAAVTAAVKKAEFSEGITATGDALKLAGTKIFSAARPGVAKILFLVTDGITNWGDEPVNEAKVLKDQGVKIVTVGITNEIDEKALRKISSNGKVSQVNKFSELSSLIASLGKEACAASK